MTRAFSLVGDIRRDSIASAVINAVISVGFFLVFFGGTDLVPVWGMGNYAFDVVPQSFAIGFFGSFVPGLLRRLNNALHTLASLSVEVEPS